MEERHYSRLLQIKQRYILLFREQRCWGSIFQRSYTKLRLMVSWTCIV